jgi:hypothetical protein
MLWHSARGVGIAVTYCLDNRGHLYVSGRQYLVYQTREGASAGKEKYFQVEQVKSPMKKEGERLDKSRPIIPMQQTIGAGSWDASYLAEASRKPKNLRKEEEFATNRLVAEIPGRHQVHFEEDQSVPDRATQVQVGMTPE